MLRDLTGFLASHALGQPERPAFLQGDDRVSYAALEVAVRRATAAYRSAGFGPGHTIGLRMRDTVENFVQLLALVRAGCLVMPMDIRWTADEVGRIARFYDVSTIVTERSGDVAVSSGRALAAPDPHQGDPSNGAAGVSVQSDLPAILSLTSGTTGIPKAVALRHALYVDRLVCEAITLGAHNEDVNLCATPVYFGAARNITFTYLFVGAAVCLFPPPYEPEALARAASRFGATSTYLVPTLIRRLLGVASPGELLFPTLRLLMSGGAILHPEEWTRVREALTPRLMNIYATSEAGLISYLGPDAEARHAASVGRPAFMTDVEVVDAEGRHAPPGTVGRIRYRSPQVPDAFYMNPDATAEAFRDGWYYPGDLGKVDSEGYLYLVGRDKDMIIRGGINVYPAEIEAALLAHPAVSEVAVVGAPSKEFGEEIAAFVIRRSDVEAAELVAHCRERLAPYKVPRVVAFTQEFPRTAAGKIVKAGLAARLQTVDRPTEGGVT